MLRSDSTLRRWYRFYNRRYFADSLPTVSVQWSDKADTEDKAELGQDLAITLCGQPVIIILINKKLRLLGYWNIIRGSLLHEMAHVETGCTGGHGAKFNKIMKRLAKAGAFDKKSGRYGASSW